MKALAYILEAFKEPLAAREIVIPDLEPGQVLVKISAAGVCGSDLHIWKGEDPRSRLPMILGHEGVGKIAALKGKKLTVEGEELKEGDLIFWNRGVSCGHCYYCAVLKEPSLCHNRIVQGINIPCTHAPYLNGCYAEYIVLQANTDIFLVPAGIDPAVLVAASCSGATAAHGFDMIRPEPGEVVAIIGPGPLGLFAVAFARAYGASTVILIGGSPARLEMGRQFGGTVILNRHEISKEKRWQIIRDLTHGRGVDLVVEAAGSAPALQEALEIVRPGGNVLSIGFSQPGGTFAFDGFQHLVQKNIRLQGVWVSDTRHVYRAMAMILAQPELFARMITHRFPLARVDEALEVMDRKEAVKAVLIP
ncbi:zinc-binding dehydrogenase [Neomoorella thermoacetica]|uniref:zinc-binding dehydrogenase n=1 Tax=Neomoorella thermoacetica TaxID=1525 RepID=UPI0008FB1897|nr:zinc-binding dehydrogenase [Moorella thermoacetica]APC08997.1 5-exo-hydroxycamphor dehydrogenase [Moorella thermoacetica]OIQ55055.1 5-exo-hydroxycamphor dehydrogenase [Moorella thermoacetica]